MGEEDREDALAAILPGEETVLLEGKMDSLDRLTYGTTCAIASCLAASTLAAFTSHTEMESLPLSPFAPLSPRGFLVEADEVVKGLSGMRFMCSWVAHLGLTYLKADQDRRLPFTCRCVLFF